MKAFFIMAAVVSALDVTEDYVPGPTYEAAKTGLHEMTVAEMEAHRQTDEYQEFLQSPLVQTVNLLMYPIVSQSFELQPYVPEDDGDSSDSMWADYEDEIHHSNGLAFDDNFAFAPWGDNLIRWLIRFNLRPLCWFIGDYEVMFAIQVQMFYNCQTWMNVDLLAFQPDWCIIGFCPKITELWNGINANAFDSYY